MAAAAAARARACGRTCGPGVAHRSRPPLARPPPSRCLSRRRPPLRPCTSRALACATDASVADAAHREAVERVGAVAASNGASLDLSGLGLVAVPDEVFDLLGGPDSRLEALSLASNALTQLPPRIRELPRLVLLALAGNTLLGLPDALGECAHLEGLWAHGNAIRELPATLGRCTALQTLSLSGNELEALPEALGALRALRSLAVAGNRLRALPEATGDMAALESLEAHGNAIEALPRSVSRLYSLKSLALQGNALRGVGCLAPLGGCRQLEALNVASNAQLEELPGSLAELPRLTELMAYGTALRALPRGLLTQRALKAVWVEGAPLDAAWTREGVAEASAGAAKLGLDEDQWADCCGMAGGVQARLPPPPAGVNVSAVLGGDAASRRANAAFGYFKLTKGGGDLAPPAQVLVVALGSAPGEPNWAGALGRVRREQGAAAAARWDTCYVVDARRDWYRADGFTEMLAAAAAGYRRVLVVGDSMGGSGALVMSPAATRVLAFTPQVDLLTSALRPGGGSGNGAAERAFTGALMRALCTARERCCAVEVHTGNWENDLAQADFAGQAGDHVRVEVHPHDTHRVAKALLDGGSLVRILQNAVEAEMTAAEAAGVPAEPVAGSSSLNPEPVKPFFS